MLVSSLDKLDLSNLPIDVCIIGAGAAGITLACELDGSPMRVLLLESGEIKHAATGTDDYRGTANEPHPDPTQYRRVNLGGTTSIWGGRCTPLDPIDFEPRADLLNSGWPISYEQVARWYPKAMQYCDAGAADFTATGSLSNPEPLVPLLTNSDVLKADAIERYSLPTHFGNRYRQKLADSKNVSVVLGTRCVQLHQSADGQAITDIEVVGADGKRRRISADTFVLSTGGIETARLLLASSPAGIGNRQDLVGRYYACHFENVMGRLVTHGKGVKFDFEKTADGVYCRRKLQFQPQAIRQHRLLNTAFRLHFPNYSDASHCNAVMSSIFLVKSLLLPEYRAILRHGTADAVASPRWQHLRNVLFGVPQLLRFGWVWLFGRVFATRKLPYTLQPNADGSYPLEFNCEQTPLPESRITLDPTQKDRHGLPRVRIDWRLMPEDVERACRGFRLLRDAIAQVPGLRLEFDETTMAEQMRRSVPLGGHHIGTARMAATAETGVVDADCAVFETPNLFVASSAVFPTSGHANPTLTIVALAARLAAHLKQRFSTHEKP